jgi:hypothetical protein
LSFSAAVVLLIHNYLHGKRSLEAGDQGSGDSPDMSQDTDREMCDDTVEYANEGISMDADGEIDSCQRYPV